MLETDGREWGRMEKTSISSIVFISAVAGFSGLWKSFDVRRSYEAIAKITTASVAFPKPINAFTSWKQDGFIG